MNDAIRISSPADILGFIPHTLGFVPRESFVFLTMRGKTLGATLRVDAPASAEPAGFARSMVDYLALDTQATAVLLAIYTASTPGPVKPRPFHDHVEAVIEALEAAQAPRCRTRGWSPRRTGKTCCATATPGAARPNRWNPSPTGS